MLYLGCSYASSYMGRMVQYFDVCVYPVYASFRYIALCLWTCVEHVVITNLIISYMSGHPSY